MASIFAWSKERHSAARVAASRGSVFARVLIGLAVSVSIASGCARPYRGPKTLAAIGAGLLGAGSVAWVAGERRDQQALTRAGMGTAALGAALSIAAAGWLAGSIGCQADPDCADDEVCREIPAPPGREPYRQCMPP